MRLPPRRPPNLLCVILASCLSIAGCATSPSSTAPVTAQWATGDTQAGAGLLRGATVLVACETPDLALRQLCQDELAQALSDRGARPVPADPGLAPLPGRPLDEQLVAGAERAGAKALVVMSLRPVAVDEGSPLSLSIGGFGFGRGSAVGGGLTAPVGGSRVETAFAANGRVSDVASKRLVWTASASGRPEPSDSRDARMQLAALSSSILDAAEAAGLF